MRAVALFAAGLAAVVAGPAIAASPTVYTYANAAFPVEQTISPFGPAPEASPTYGQVFVSPKSGTLTAFSFTLTGGVGQIRAGLGRWNGAYNNIPGGGSPVTLWESDFVTSGAGTITFNPGVQILDLTKYVAYITVFGSPDAEGSTTLVLGDDSQEAALRYFTFDNGLGNPSGNPAWSSYGVGTGDALFSFSVANVPEPAEWALMIAGFGLVGAVARRRRSGLALAA